MKPRFISFEGTEGSGKTTQIARLARRLEDAGSRVLTLREPGGTPLGEIIRDLLKHHPSGVGMSAEAELLLFAASRAELVRKRIQPALDAGEWVLCDRFLDSTTVYQGLARGLADDIVAAVNRLAVGPLLPSLTLVLDLDPATARARQQSRSAADRLEREPDAFFETVAAGFRRLAAEHPGRIHLIPADGGEDAVAAAIWKELTHAFPGTLA